MNHYELKIEAKRERYAELAAKNAALATRQSEAGWKALEIIPFGQPILVGHHSERADRSYRARARNMIGRSIETSDKAKYYEAKTESVGTAGISQDDPDAIKKLKEKLVNMQAKWDEIKRLRKEGKDTWAWGVSTANIRNIKKRIEQLEAKASMETRPDVIGNGFTLRENKEENRIQFIFDGKPSEEVRSALKHGGFRWSPTNNAWQAFLTNRGRYQAKIVLNLINSL